MLTRVEIRDFRSCHDVVLDDLGPVTALVGRNAVGKTNILKAIQWAAKAATETKPNKRRVGLGHVSLRVEIENGLYEYSIERSIRQDNRQDLNLSEILTHRPSSGRTLMLLDRNNENVIIKSPETRQQISMSGTASCMPALVSLLPPDTPMLGLIRPVLAFFERIRYYPLAADSDEDDKPLIWKRDYDDWLSRHRETGVPSTSVQLRLLHLHLSDKAKFEEISNLLGVNGLGIVDGISVHPVDIPDPIEQKGQESVTAYFLWFTPGGQGKKGGYLQFSDLSEGTRRVITILVSLFFDRSGVMLLEHPEDAIHRGLLRKVIGLLQTYGDQSQLILTSHSPVVFNSLPPASVRLVTMEEGATKARALSTEELGAVESYLENEGSFAEFLETIEEE